jgi:hypothetical protein
MIGLSFNVPRRYSHRAQSGFDNIMTFFVGGKCWIFFEPMFVRRTAHAMVVVVVTTKV